MERVRVEFRQSDQQWLAGVARCDASVLAQDDTGAEWSFAGLAEDEARALAALLVNVVRITKRRA